MLIVGAGAAGLFAAIRAKEAGVDVVVVDKAQSGFGGASPIGMQLILLQTLILKCLTCVIFR